jgi:hypothetical protein
MSAMSCMERYKLKHNDYCNLRKVECLNSCLH